MPKMIFPEYHEHIGGLSAQPDGQQRFYINIGEVTKTTLHHHDYAEFSLFVEGSGTETINGVTHRVKPGTASFLLPHHMHKLDSEPNAKMRKYRCMFDLPLLFGANEDPEFSRLLFGIGTVFPSFVDLEGADAGRMRNTLDQLLEEFGKPENPGRQHMIRLKLSEALLLFVRAGAKNRHLAARQDREDKIGLSPMLQYVHLHYTERLSLEELAKTFNHSVPYISRSFKELTGKGFHDYVRSLRIESAVTMLLHTNMSVTDIAAAVGFDSFRTFARAFREMKNMTASEFRAAMRSGSAPE